MLSVRARLPVTLLVTALILPALVRSAHADVASCLAGYERGQRLRKQGKHLEARRVLQQCMRSECPASVRKDCLGWSEEVLAETPSIAVKAQGADGCDRPKATYTIDDAPEPHATDALAVDVDPGPHVLRADIDGKKVEQSVVVAVRERGRVVTMLADPSVTTCGLVTPKPVTTGKQPPSNPGRDHGETTSRPLSPLAVALAGTGVVALGVGIGFSIAGFNQKSALDDCRGACLQDDVDAMNRSFLIGDVALGVGAAALVVAAILHFTR